MSTRSGKRIHNSFHENTIKTDLEGTVRSERKTRGKRFKENDEDLTTQTKTRRRHNYVRYPTDDESIPDQTLVSVKNDKTLALKEFNTNILVETKDVESKSTVRLTRRTRKFVEDILLEEQVSHVNGNDVAISEDKKKGKKGKNKTNHTERRNAVPKKKKNKKKRSGSGAVGDSSQNVEETNLNRTATSMDSFHSAAGSPHGKIVDCSGQSSDTKITINTTFEKPVDEEEVPVVLNNTFDKDTKIKRRSSLRNKSIDKSINTNTPLLNSTFDKNEGGNNTDVTSDVNSARKRKSIKSLDPDTKTISLSETFEKSPQQKTSTINTTFDKQKETKLDSTFDKIETSHSKSSLISSDGTDNISENSLISVTSDESKTENIVNITPVLIESSLDESAIQESEKSKPTAAQTPLKREGTFTKNGPEVLPASPKPKLSNGTPSKHRMSLPSPGCTPFHVNKSNQKGKSLMNVTRSIEKSRRSSIADMLSRTAKVMFCSPVDNPVVVAEKKSKLIKSSMKGSNKSFIFNDTEAVAPAPRKRSLTLGDAAPTRATRSRLADDMLQSVERLSRPRTSSAVVKPSEPPTPRTTPAKSDTKGRTKLPNFAALHQKRFEKMESLDECQERKAKRAKQLLVPTGSVTVLERSSPKAAPATPKRLESAKKSAAQTQEKKKTRELAKTPATQWKTKLPAPETVKPGYNRFGFKSNFNSDVNPFSIPPKEKKDGKKETTKPDVNPFSIPPKEKKETTKPTKLNGLNGLTRQHTMPSITGATSRKEAAKQLIMREKSFTKDKMALRRQENRTLIKGVRTNRRFELQMKMRGDIDG